jgi:hypothetical protein
MWERQGESYASGRIKKRDRDHESGIFRIWFSRFYNLFIELSKQ